MPPQQHNQPTPPAGGPQKSFTPQAPHFGFGDDNSQHFQQHPSGHYEVVPPPAQGQNNGRSGHNPYEFIVNPDKPKRSTNLFSGGSLSGKNIGIIVGGAVLLLFVVAVVVSSLAPKGSTPGLEAIAQRQQEIIRITTAASMAANSSDTKNFVVTTEMTVTSSQQQTLAYLQAHGVKMKPKQLALDNDPKTDTLLADATSAGTYDTVVVQNLTDQLRGYQGLLQSTFKQTNSQSAKQLLQSSYDTAAKLLAQAKALSE